MLILAQNWESFSREFIGQNWTSFSDFEPSVCNIFCNNPEIEYFRPTYFNKESVNFRLKNKWNYGNLNTYVLIRSPNLIELEAVDPDRLYSNHLVTLLTLRAVIDPLAEFFWKPKNNSYFLQTITFIQKFSNAQTHSTLQTKIHSISPSVWLIPFAWEKRRKRQTTFALSHGHFVPNYQKTYKRQLIWISPRRSCNNRSHKERQFHRCFVQTSGTPKSKNVHI